MPDAKANGFGWATREIVERTRAIARLEIELAILEVKRKLVRLGIGTGLGAGAAVLLFYAIGVLIAAAAVGLALAVPLWASLLIVAGVLLLLVALLGWLAVRSFQAGAPPVPQEAIEEAKLTTDTLLTNE